MARGRIPDGASPRRLQNLMQRADEMETIVKIASVPAPPPSAEPSDKVPAALRAHLEELRRDFPEAYSFITDQSPLKWALCTRRAAKSYSLGLEFIIDSYSYPKANYVIVGLHRPDVKRNYWKDVLQDIDYRYGLNAKFREDELSMTMPNGAVIYLTGADASEKERRKLLGGKNRKIGVDEAQDWHTDLQTMIMSVLKPSVADYRGTISVIGTPSNMISGFFHTLTNGCHAGRPLSPPGTREPGWAGHTWTTFQNPYMRAQWKAEIADLRAANPLVEELNWFRQNYLGEWVVDLDALCYKFDPVRNAYDGELPNISDRRGRWHYVLAVDLGYAPDPSAFLVYAYHDFDDTLFGVESWKEWRLDITDVSNRTNLYKKSYSFDALVIDGANKQAVEEMRRRHNLNFTAADKTGKSDFIELMNAELRLGKIKFDLSRCNQGRNDPMQKEKKVLEGLSISDEYGGLIWDPRKLIDGKREEHPGCPNHLADAALYGWRHCYQYLSRAPEVPPAPGTDQWFRAEAERMHQAAIDAVQEQQANGDGLGESSNWETWAH